VFDLEIGVMDVVAEEHKIMEEIRPFPTRKIDWAVLFSAEVDSKIRELSVIRYLLLEGREKIYRRGHGDRTQRALRRESWKMPWERSEYR
jgi:hypothetical protein